MNFDIFALFSPLFESEKTYLITPISAYSYRQIDRLSDEAGREFFKHGGRYLIDIHDPLRLIVFIWACVKQKHSFCVIPPSISDQLKTKISSQSACDQMIFDDSQNVVSTRSLKLKMSKSKSVKKSPSIGFLSSGTTGSSKLIWVSYEKIILSLKAIKDYDFMPYTANQTALIGSPPYHSYGFSCLLEYTMGGSKIIIPASYEPLAILKLLAGPLAETISAVEAVPYFHQQLLIIRSKISLKNLKHVGIGGDFVTERLLTSLINKYGAFSLSIRYGLTEYFSIISLAYFDSGNIEFPAYGRVLPIFEVVIAMEKGEALQSGEIMVRLKTMENIFLPTFDIGRLRNGKLEIQGRKGRLLKHKGYRLNPAVIEEQAINSKLISDAFCFSTDDKLTLKIIPLNGHFKEQMLIDWLAKDLPNYLIPDKILLVKKIERTPTGKIIISGTPS